MPTINSSIIGVNMGNTSDGTTQNFALGTTCFGTQDSEWVYVTVATSQPVTGACLFVNISGTAFGCQSQGSGALYGWQLAFAQAPFATNDFGWVARRGIGIYVLVSSCSTLSCNLYYASGTGILSSQAAASGTALSINLFTAAATATAVPQQAWVSWPRTGTALSPM